MNLEEIRTKWNKDLLTYQEAESALRTHETYTDIIAELLEMWQLVRTLRRQWQATNPDERWSQAVGSVDPQQVVDSLEPKPPSPHMQHEIVVSLIDHAYLTDHIGPFVAARYWQAAGMELPERKDHLDALLATKNKDAERKKYLEDPDNAPRYCTRCGRKMHTKLLSNRAICEPCAIAAHYQSIAQLRDKKGPYFRKWRAGMVAFLYRLETQLIQESRDKEPSTLGDMLDAENLLCEICGTILHSEEDDWQDTDTGVICGSCMQDADAEEARFDYDFGEPGPPSKPF